MNANTITTGEVRLSYVNVFEPQTRPGSEPKYSVTVLVPKSDTATKAAIDAAIAAAIEMGVNRCWNGVRPPQPAICVHDGDGPRPSDGQPFGAECKGMWVFTASSKNQPGVVDINIQPILDPREVYSGCYGRVNVTFFPYNSNGKKGIGCALNHVQKLRDGEPLVDRVTAEEAFGTPIASSTPSYGAQYTAPSTGGTGGYVNPWASTANPQQPAGGVNPFTGLPL